VVIDFDASVAELVRSRRVHETQKLTTLQNGTLRLSMTVGDTTELGSWVLGWGRKATVIEPETLARDVATELLQALARYPAVATAPAVTEDRVKKSEAGKSSGRARARKT
jgi:predicted DNA-binding transcriptional regulator YafY